MIFHVPLFAIVKGERVAVGMAEVEEDFEAGTSETSAIITNPELAKFVKSYGEEHFGFSVEVDIDRNVPVEADLVIRH